jgi:nitrile hydratase
LKRQFKIGEIVRIRYTDPPGHIRTPYFIRGKIGQVIRILGTFANPEELAYGRDGKPIKPVYSVRFLQKDLWKNYTGQLKDTAIVEVMENWLEKNDVGQNSIDKKNREITHKYSNYDIKRTNGNETSENDSSLTEHMIMAQAVEELLIEKKVFSTDELNQKLEEIDSQSPVLGARLVARAWIDSDFKDRLLQDVNATAKETGIDAGPIQILAIENTPVLHNTIVCTLCSCYPKFLIGLPPKWYKSREYRSRMISEPRIVLAEFGTIISNNVEVRIYDSTAELRYMVLPMPPENIKGLNEDQLIALVTRDSMIGTSLLKSH